MIDNDEKFDLEEERLRKEEIKRRRGEEAIKRAEAARKKAAEKYRLIAEEEFCKHEEEQIAEEKRKEEAARMFPNQNKERSEKTHKTGVDSVKGLDLHKGHDSIYTMGNDEATILYIAVMLGAIIFKDRLLIWIAATITYYWHLTRHKRR